MRHRIDPLITERAPWLHRNRPGTGLARHSLETLLGYGKTLEIAERLHLRSTAELMGFMGRLLARRVSASGLDRIPRQGPALLVANHPTGIADGIILHHLIARHRPDLFIYANSDILRIMPQMDSLIVPVEWRQDRRSLTKTRETMALTRKAIEAGRIGLIFPSGRLAKRRGLKLHERPWMTSAAMIARKFDLPVIPINVQARNSALFYLFDLIHPTLRDITLFHETLNKHRQPYRITVGEPISPSALPARSEDGIELLRRTTLALGGRHAPALSLIESTARPRWIQAS